MFDSVCKVLYEYFNVALSMDIYLVSTFCSDDAWFVN